MTTADLFSVLPVPSTVKLVPETKTTDPTLLPLEVAPGTFTGSLDETTVLLSISFRYMGWVRALTTDEFEVEDGIDKTRVVARKRLFGESTRLVAILRHMSQTSRFIRRQCSPSLLRESVFRLHISLLPSLIERLQARDEMLKALVAEFVAGYDEDIEADRLALGPVFDPNDYRPLAEVPGLFGMTWHFLSTGAPTQLKTLDAALYAKEVARVREHADEVKAKYVLLQREVFAGLNAKVLDMLTPATDGKRRQIRGATFDKLTEAIKQLPMRNFGDDDDLMALAAQLDGLLAGVDVDAIKDDATVLAQTRKQFDAVAQQLAGLVETAKLGQRRIVLD